MFSSAPFQFVEGRLVLDEPHVDLPVQHLTWNLVELAAIDADALTHGRLRPRYALRSARERPLFDDGEEVLDLQQVHESTPEAACG